VCGSPRAIAYTCWSCYNPHDESAADHSGIIRCGRSILDLLLKTGFRIGREIMENEKKDISEEAEKIDPKEAEKFWDKAVSDAPKTKSENGDILTYEEALDEGILPEDTD
jgi:hypothetical protein